MKIIGLNTGHDGHICLIEDGRLIFSHEAEKNSGHRYAPVAISTLTETLLMHSPSVDAIAISGWAEGHDPRNQPTDGGYFGLTPSTKQIEHNGKFLHWSNCSHELSHIIASYALSPYADLTNCYVLLWEGFIGSFYKVDTNLKVVLIGSVMQSPGLRYAFAYGVADPDFNLPKGYCRLGDAGKMMALVAYGKSVPDTPEESKILDYLIDSPSPIDSFTKKDLAGSPFYNIGVTHPDFCNLAKKLSDRLFDKFQNFITHNMNEKLPLVISGGCGLNCEWNKKWEDSALFDGVFVPPCTNDTGVAIGAAAAAQKALTGRVGLQWTVYSGQPFINNVPAFEENFYKTPLIVEDICKKLMTGDVICWVQGNCEIGPRALGNRSIIAAPFSEGTTKKINALKRRENYRPVAPICLEEDAHLHFSNCVASKYMLSFHTVIDDRLKAITHVDGSARVQTVTNTDNPPLYKLLSEFKTFSGVGVLCNTSLNFKGRGFINSHSDLEKFCLENDINTYVIDQHMFTRTRGI